MPHVFVILFFLVLVATISTWIIPPGQFDYQQVDVNGTMRELVVPGSFHYVDRAEASPVGIIDFFCSFHRGMIASAEIMMMIFIVNAARRGPSTALWVLCCGSLTGRKRYWSPCSF